MARAYNDQLREDAARAVMDDSGFLYTGGRTLLQEAAAGNPRCRAWVKTADCVLAIVFPRLSKA